MYVYSYMVPDRMGAGQEQDTTSGLNNKNRDIMAWLRIVSIVMVSFRYDASGSCHLYRRVVYQRRPPSYSMRQNEVLYLPV
jgi:hypothetical protein